MPHNLFDVVLSAVSQLQVGQIESLIELRGQLDGFIAKTEFPKQDTSLDASYVCYNMARAPMGFDFLTWLIDQEMTRIRWGAPAPLKVGLWPGNTVLKPENVQWVNRVYRPLISMLGAVEDPAAIHGIQKELYVPLDIVKGSRAGEEVPRLYGTLFAEVLGAVTITLRESDYYPQRNSRVSEWYRFALHLKAADERVIFVRDTAKAYEPIQGFETFPAASLHLEGRTGLYAGAKMNFFVSNGPSSLCSFSSWPYITFIPPVDNYVPGTSSFWKDSCDMSPGDNWPWARENQRLVWEHDFYENILRSWELNAGAG